MLFVLVLAIIGALAAAVVVKTEPKYPFEFLTSERLPISVDNITVKEGQVLDVGDIIAKEFVGTAASAAWAGNTGNGAMGAITVSALAKPGVYALEIIKVTANAGVFNLFDPDGILVKVGNVASAFSAGGLAFTLADGATDFIVGDGFDITVTEGASVYVIATGSNAVGILAEAVDATDDDTPGIAVMRFAEFNEDKVGYGAMNTAAKKLAKAALAKAFLIARSSL